MCKGLTKRLEPTVTWLLAWLALADHPRDDNGVRKGPLFGKLTAKGNQKSTSRNQKIERASSKTLLVKVGGSTSPDQLVWATEDGNRVNLSEDMIEKIGKEAREGAIKLARERVCQEACTCEGCAQLRESIERLSDSTYHGWRVGFAVWGARTGGERGYVQTKLGGRWERLSEVFDIYWGFGESRRNQLRGQADPLLEKMPWPLQGFTFRSMSAPSLWEMRQSAWTHGSRGNRTSKGGGRREGVTGKGRPGGRTIVSAAKR